ncbi:methionine aminopeptidase, type II [Archaeoglobus sulfaticallidus PM70-1]|uniref:Methionine aminopeptidase n=1 Tax=Archaeoglobus sulfaticallidus PM70-1 TaxID=387631 RepID=N0BNT5_9EURY|nr:type II methionyl aminopeptidase [Archaeoglobus sulfaticallidus]AGK61995.1 methionine aminopeptidase, type II [Archaeoglobus sulfaticallidus PM70-1]
MELEEIHEKTIEAGKILKTVKEEVKPLVKPGVKLLEVAEFVENRIRELGGEPAFPCNISINSDAAHFTPKKGDTREFNEGDIVKLDIGAHIEGIIADTAITIDLGDNDDLVKASENALKRAIEEIHAGVDTAVIGRVIESEIREFGFRPVVNLTGHGLLPYIAHAPPSILNYGTERGVKLEEGMVIAIEPFATDGAGKVGERGETEIFSLKAIRPVRMKKAKALLKEIEKYKTLPFAKRWLENASDIVIGQLVRAGVLRGYPVLTEIAKGLVSQAEHTVIVEEDGARIVT